MKNIMCIFALFILSFALMAIPGAAEPNTLILPQDLNSIKEEAFYGDSSIGKVVLPESVIEIGARAFANSSISEIHLPDSLTSIDGTAFVGTENVVFRANTGSYAYKWIVENGLFVPVEDIKFKNEICAGAGETIDLRKYYTVVPGNATDPHLEWFVDDQEIATVDANGIVTTHSLGYADITGRTKDGSDVEVVICLDVIYEKPRISQSTKPNGTSVTVWWSDLQEASYYIIEIAEDEAFGKMYNYYQVEAPNSALYLHGLKENTQYYVRISVAYGEYIVDPVYTSDVYTFTTGTATVPKKVTNIYYNGYEGFAGNMGSCSVGETYASLRANLSFEPNDATNQQVTWTSSNPQVATIDQENGTLIGLSKGVTQLTATACDGSGVTVTGWFYVGPDAPTGVTATSDGTSIKVSWNAVDDADYYAVQCLGGIYDIAIEDGITDCEFTVNGMDTNTTYLVSVCAGEDLGDDYGIAYGSMSEPVEAVTGDTAGYTPVRGIIVEEYYLLLYVGYSDYAMSNVRVLPNYATNKRLDWASADTSIVRVNEKTGYATGVAPGITYITATSPDDPRVSASIIVEVLAA